MTRQKNDRWPCPCSCTCVWDIECWDLDCMAPDHCHCVTQNCDCEDPSMAPYYAAAEAVITKGIPNDTGN